MKIHCLNAFNDNYIWLIEQVDAIWVVDPGEAEPVLNWLSNNQRTLSGVLITHHHADHINGVDGLLKAFPHIHIFAPASLTKLPITHPLKDDDEIQLGQDRFKVIATPGHTLDHLCFVGDDALFCGDTLFTGGCGRVFEGDADQMADSLAKLLKLPGHLKVYCGHEYSLANLNFAMRVEPNNNQLIQRLTMINLAYKLKQAIPVNDLKLEFDTNPFLRTNEKTLVSVIAQRLNCSTADLTQGKKFAALRSWKDELDATGILEKTF